MKTLTYKVYKFNELTEESKDRAVQTYYDINVEDDWWNMTYEDAERIGLKITSFDIGRARDIEGDFVDEPVKVAQSIKGEHGKSCDTYKVAIKYLDSTAYEDDEVFKQDVLDCYLKQLDNEYAHLISEDTIVETFKANDYDFLENGDLNPPL